MGIEKLNESFYRKFELNEKLDDEFTSVNFYEDNLEDCDDDVEDCDEDVLVECDHLDEDYQFPETDYFNITENLDDYDGNILTEAEIKLSGDLLDDPKSIDFKALTKKAVDDEKKAAEEKAAAERKEELYNKYKDILDKIKAGHGKPDEDSSRFQIAFDELVPSQGKADTQAGELIRAMGRILYRWFNDGDVFYKGYGVETVLPSIAFIYKYGPDGVKELVDDAVEKTQEYGDPNFFEENGGYEEFLNNTAEFVVNYILDNPELIAEEPKEDSRDTDNDILDIPRWEWDVEIPYEIEQHIDNGHISWNDVHDILDDFVRDQYQYRRSGAYVDQVYLGAFTIRDLDGEAIDHIGNELEKLFSSWARDLDNEYPEDEDDDSEEIEEESLTEANENPNEDTDPEVDDDVYPNESLEEIIEKYLTAIHDAMAEGYINIDQEINNVEDFKWVFHKCYRFTEDENDRDFYRYINDIYKAWVNNGEQDEWNDEYWYQHEDDIEESLTEAREYDGLPDDMWTFMYDAMFEGPRARPAILDYARNYLSLNFDTDNYASNKSVSRFIGDDPRYDVAIGVKGQNPEELEFAKEVFDKCKLENTGIEKVNSDSRYPYRIVAKIPTDKNGDPIKTKDYFASMGEKKPVRKQNIPSKTYGTKKKNESYDLGDWELVKSKSVYDSDGFLTEYSMWYNKDTGAYNFIFGDSDIYTPDTADFDWEDIYDKDLADEWFDNYTGFGEEDEDFNEALNESSVQKDSFKKDDKELVWGADKDNGYYVRLYSNCDEEPCTVEFNKHYSGPEAAKRAFERYKKSHLFEEKVGASMRPYLAKK